MPEFNKNAGKQAVREQRRQQSMICDGLSFAAAEAYKLLRTNLLFALPDKKCRIIGISSSVRGEGKSTTAVNLAYTLAQTGRPVLLIDADMRLPSISAKMSIPSKPGLSNLLAGMCSEREAMLESKYYSNWYILPAGDEPPNPSELLGSDRMHKFIDHLATIFDFIVVDLPPITIVTDALAVSPFVDGLALVVRQNYTDRRALSECMSYVSKLDTKFLGFVMTDVSMGESSYKHYGKYGYGNGYESSRGTEKADVPSKSSKREEPGPKPQANKPEQLWQKMKKLVRPGDE